MKIRTSKDNRHLTPGERQIEDICGAVSARPTLFNRVVPAVEVITTRGIEGRKAQLAVLSREGVDALIAELQRVRDEVFGEPPVAS